MNSLEVSVRKQYVSQASCHASFAREPHDDAQPPLKRDPKIRVSGRPTICSCRTMPLQPMQRKQCWAVCAGLLPAHLRRGDQHRGAPAGDNPDTAARVWGVGRESLSTIRMIKGVTVGEPFHCENQHSRSASCMY